MDAITQGSDATAGQMKLIHRFIGDAVGRTVGASVMNKREAQCVIERGDELAAAIRTSVTGILKDLSVGEKYPLEEVRSHHSYNSRYAPKELSEQCRELSSCFPSLNPGTLHATPLPLPCVAENWFAIPRFETIGATYHEAVETVLQVLSKRSVRFTNRRAGKLGHGHLRQSALKLAAFDKALRGGDIYLIPAQFGLRHRGRSARRTHEVFLENEFPLGIYEVAFMLLTHPERLMHVKDLWIACTGDECNDGASHSHFEFCPYFYCAHGPLELGFQRIEDFRACIGVPTGFHYTI
jgi:hypothetical protein